MINNFGSNILKSSNVYLQSSQKINITWTWMYVYVLMNIDCLVQ